MSKKVIIIPTYNRSAKLQRTLRCYNELFKNKDDIQINILDGSSKPHSDLNKALCQGYSFASYFPDPGTKMSERVVRHLKTYPDPDQIICQGTDEDVFLPEFIDYSFKFLEENPDYSTFVGRYITFLKPLGFLHRRSHDRDVIVDLNINQESFERRCSLLSQTVLVGCSPVYWGPRRVKQLLCSQNAQSKLHYLTSREMLDQVILSYQGKIHFNNTPMLLRDETKLGYVVTDDRQDINNYFAEDEKMNLLSILEEIGGKSLKTSAYSFCDKFSTEFTDNQKPSISVQHHLKTYSKYTPFNHRRKKLSSLILLLKKSTTVICEIVSAYIDISDLKEIYSPKAINIFLKIVRSNKFRSQ